MRGGVKMLVVLAFLVFVVDLLVKLAPWIVGIMAVLMVLGMYLQRREKR